jgi:hypothetical protein
MKLLMVDELPQGALARYEREERCGICDAILMSYEIEAQSEEIKFCYKCLEAELKRIEDEMLCEKIDQRFEELKST